tara:strand:+ start:13116 stop:14453 length:1338 start_codon:yes stop_codon:yes gene_type:complete
MARIGDSVNPALGRPDYTGFINAGKIRAQALQNLGDTIQSTVKQYTLNKKELDQNIARNEAIINARPDLLAKIPAIDPSEAPSGVAKALIEQEKGKFTLQNTSAISSYLMNSIEAENLQLQQLKLASEIKGAENEGNVLRVTQETADRDYVDYTQTPVVVNDAQGNPIQLVEIGQKRKNTQSDEYTDMSEESFKELVDETGVNYNHTRLVGPDGVPFIRVRDSDEQPMTPTLAGRIEKAKALGKGEAESFIKRKDDISEWFRSKRPEAISDIEKFDEMVLALSTGTARTRTFVDMLPAGDSVRDFARGFFDPESQDIVDNLRSVVQKQLKAILGGAFSQAEGERLIANAYNPMLPSDMNIARIQRAQNVMKQVLAQRDLEYQSIVKDNKLPDFADSEALLIRLNNETEEMFGSIPKIGLINQQASDNEEMSKNSISLSVEESEIN